MSLKGFFFESNYDKKTIIYIGIFGALWGFIEISLGTVLKSFKIPFSGAILSSCVAIIISISAHLNYKKGSILLMAISAALLKLIYTGGSLFGPILAITFEGFIGELIVRLSKDSYLRYLLLGTMVCLYSIAHLVVNNIIVYGLNFYIIYIKLIKKVVESIGIGDLSTSLIIIIFFSIYISFGIIASVISLLIIKRLKKRREEFKNVQ